MSWRRRLCAETVEKQGEAAKEKMKSQLKKTHRLRIEEQWVTRSLVLEKIRGAHLFYILLAGVELGIL